MRTLFIVLSFLFISIISYGQSTIWVDGYYRPNGTYVPGHYRQTPNKTNHDNWSTITLFNPYTSEPGSRAKDYSPEAKNYGGGRTIYTGPNGGQYYYNSKGNKVFVPKQ
jgi:hypothetical protein